jgi:cytochrome c peroxidase
MVTNPSTGRETATARPTVGGPRWTDSTHRQRSITLVCIMFAAAQMGSVHAFAAALEEPIKPVPALVVQDPAKAAIGRSLFNDRRLSRNKAVSCASCHDLARGGADGRDRSIGFNGQPTAVNTPTVLNAALNFKQFWNGRADSLEAQIDAVVQDPVEMGSTWVDVVGEVSRDPAYNAAFAKAYREGVTKAAIQNAIAAYIRTLITPDSRFDRYLRGDRSAITDEERSGYAKFKRYGCIACHQGVNVGGNMFQKFGVLADYLAQRPTGTSADLGRFLVTGDTADKYVFKVPSLRNVALTAPYFHDASAKTLEDAIDVMFRYQLGRLASSDDKREIAKFLNSLNGALPPP